MAFQEFYCNPSTGDNLNAGTSTGSAVYSSNSGNWDGSNTFTPTDGTNPALSCSADGVTYASIYVNGSSSPAGYIARVTSVTNAANGAIQLSTTDKIGAAPAASSGNMTIRVGGAWKGPNGSEGFPFGQITPNAKNSSGDPPRVNLKNNASYTVSSGLTATWSSVSGFVTFQGYSASVGDGGKATIDGAGGSFDVITYAGSVTNRALVLRDLIVTNSGGTGVGVKLTSAGVDTQLVRVVCHDMSSHGFSEGNGVFATHIECEAYANGGAGFSGNGVFIYCDSHDNTSHGYVETNFNATQTVYLNCIADTNGGSGFVTADNIGAHLFQCDAYNNAADGLRVATSGGFTYRINVQNCNFVKNGGWGINQTGTGALVGVVANNGFGSGAAGNTSGQIVSTITNIVSGSVTYASGVMPWVDPANGDFRINLSAAQGAGRGAFTQTQISYAGAVGYPDIGSNQHQDAGGMIMARVRTGF